MTSGKSSSNWKVRPHLTVHYVLLTKEITQFVKGEVFKKAADFYKERNQEKQAALKSTLSAQS